jgi:hypothetical protein
MAMFENVKNKVVEIKENNRHKREERERITRERAEEDARIERERIQAEKKALMALSEKELMVEAIMALRGYNTRLAIIEASRDDLEDRVSSLESDVSSLESDMSSLKLNSDQQQESVY